MPMERIYTEALITKSLIDSSQWETDEHGNPIVLIEASNENLDYDGERVMRSALMNSKGYFMKNGVISYDHKHLPSPDNFRWDPTWNAEKYIIGKPIEVFEGEGNDGKPAVKVKAVLYKSNDISKEIIKKLSDGATTVKASVGGRKVKKAQIMDKKSYMDTPTIVKVDWDEVALTYKPVNQTLGPTTLSPKEFVKALTVGSSANPADMTGGNTLQAESLEPEPISALLFDIRSGKIDKKTAIDHLVKAGYPKGKARKILKMIIDNKYIGDVVMADDKNVNDVIDTSTEELKKALEILEDGGELSKSMAKMKDGTYVRKGGHMYLKKADGKYEKMDSESPDYEDDDEEDDDDDMGKSLHGDFLGEGVYDASEDIVEMKKSIAVLKEDNADLKAILSTIVSGMDNQNAVLKAIGKSTLDNEEMLKSIGNSPAARKTQVSNLKIEERFGKSQADKINSLKVTEGQLIKSMTDAGLNLKTQSEVNMLFRKTGHNLAAVASLYPDAVQNLIKE